MTRFLRITALIIAGEMIFALPFHTQRFFRATMLEAFDISNTQLGDMFAAYGVTAMFSGSLFCTLSDGRVAGVNSLRWLLHGHVPKRLEDERSIRILGSD